MPKCAFLSLENTTGWFIDDDLVHPYLKALGWEISNIPWTQQTDWNIFDAVIIRSPWDYQSDPERFFEVLKKIEESKAILANSLSLMAWNINKNYLFELQDNGVELVPTRKILQLNEEKLQKIITENDSNPFVIKPIVGANADDTYKLSNETTKEEILKIAEIFTSKPCFVQPFMESIVNEGEFSLMYFNGKLSHTILKTVKTGDYRVQEEHGGGVTPINQPETRLIEAAERAMHALPEKPLYARVDLVRTAQNEFALMELELIEPCLYFRFCENSPKLFAECINNMYVQAEAEKESI